MQARDSADVRAQATAVHCNVTGRRVHSPLRVTDSMHTTGCAWEVVEVFIGFACLFVLVLVF